MNNQTTAKKKISVVAIALIIVALIVGLVGGWFGYKAISASQAEKAQAELLAKQREYAQLIVNFGVDMQEGDTLLIKTSPNYAEFVTLLTEAAYEAKAAEVAYWWTDENFESLKAQNADEDILVTFPSGETAMLDEYFNQKKTSLLKLTAPTFLDDGTIDSERKALWNETRIENIHWTSQLTANDERIWTIAAVPTKQWAQMMYPDLSADEAVMALWNDIFQACRVDGDGTSIVDNEANVAELNSLANKLTEYDFESLHFTNSLGTDVTIGLVPNHIWMSAGMSKLKGTDRLFVANIPSEEVYTAPDYRTVNGVIYASRPLSLDGALIEDICVTVEDGKIVDATASSGLETLTKTLDADEGSRYFGEISLVSCKSPIALMNKVFYMTLFDENAACHIAFGFSYPSCLANSDSMTEDELKEAGMNQSSKHVDFMFGTNDMKVVGKMKDGTEVVVFENGTWAF